MSKPKYGREGENVLFSSDFNSYEGFIEATERASYTSPINNMPLGAPVYQKMVDLPQSQTRTILTSSWVINGNPAGLCFREDTQRVTNNNSAFLPHYIKYDEKDKD